MRWADFKAASKSGAGGNWIIEMHGPGVTAYELSSILETNPDMLNMLIDMGGGIYKSYRIYERGL